jgi:hypothetical protein
VTVNDGNIRVRYSSSGAGWPVRTINPAKTEPKKDSRRVRPFALVLGGAAIVCILAGVAVFSQRAPQLFSSANQLGTEHPTRLYKSRVITAIVI